MTEQWDGRPQNPERDGWHWLQRVDDGWRVCRWWSAEIAGWVDGITLSPSTVVEYGVHYLGPCRTPAEVAACVKAARREGIEAAAQLADGEWCCECPQMLDIGEVCCGSPLRVCDTALPSRIRALLEDGR